MEVGTIWNGWKVTSFLGEGSFGKVYRIVREDLGFSYESALKVIRIPQNSSELKAARLEGMSEKSVTDYFYNMVEDIAAELSLMSKLRGNSNVVSFEDHKIEKLQDAFGWEIYIRMELLTPLFEYINSHDLSQNDVIRMGVDLCQALELCQKYRIIHRDIKPDNIFVSRQGHFKLGDFGIAKQLEKNSAEMSKKGSPSYMAPEVYKGETYTSTVDIYSLGIVMYQFLNNNRTPFLPLFPEPLHYSDKEQASQKRVSGAAIPPPCNADQELAEIVLRACAYDSANRYQTPGEMKRDLMELLPSAEAYPDSPAEVESTREGLSDIDTEEKTRFIFDQYTEKGGKSLQGEAANADASGDSCKKGPGRRLRSAILLCILLIALLCGSVAAYRYYHHAVPSVVGMEPDGAKEVLRDAGLGYAENGKEFSDRIEQGQILSQNRAKGEKVKKGTVVTVVISRGKKIIIPKLRGISLDQANREMSELGLVLREEKRVFHDTVKKDCIVSQKPDEGSVAEKGTGVTVVISKGVEKVAVPNIEGKDRDTARRKLREAGLKVSESESYSNSTPKGYVIYQTVEPDNKIKKKSKVGIVISLGPEPVTYTQDNDNTSSAKKKSSSKSLKKGHGNIV